MDSKHAWLGSVTVGWSTKNREVVGSTPNLTGEDQGSKVIGTSSYYSGKLLFADR